MKNADFETKFAYAAGENKNAGENVSVIEAIAAAARLHAALVGVEVSERSGVCYKHSFRLDDPSVIVDLKKRNSRNNDGISFNRGASGEIENASLKINPVVKEDGTAVAIVSFNGLSLAAKDYNKLSLRVRRQACGTASAGEEKLTVFFKTSANSFPNEEKSFSVMTDALEGGEWVTFELEAAENKNWCDYITSLQVNLPTVNGTYYIDTFTVSASEKYTEKKWYNKYVDYAVDNGICDKEKFSEARYNENITRGEMCELVASAAGEGNLPAICTVSGIADISRESINADVYLMLFKAGVICNGDEKGSLVPKAAVSYGEMCEMFTRVLDSEKRVAFEGACDWKENACEYDVEFDGDEHKYTLSGGKVLDSVCTFEFSDADKENFESLTPKLVLDNIELCAEKYAKMRVRMKPHFDTTPERKLVTLYYKTEGDCDFSKDKCMKTDYERNFYKDAAGWLLVEIDFGFFHKWKGKITGIMFDAVSGNGKFEVDYIRFIKHDEDYNKSHEELTRLGYKRHGMLQDITFERGFHVEHFEHKKVELNERIWQTYYEGAERPLWDVGPWWCSYDLWDHRDTSADKYTLTDDRGINTIRYNPGEKSVLMRVNCTKIYNGKPHDVNTYKWWPHLLLNQHYGKYPVDKVKNRADADRIFLEMDIRMPDFKDTINTEGTNVCAFLLYFYFVTDKARSEKIWYGFRLFNGGFRSGNFDAKPDIAPGWAPDSAAHQYMYAIPMATVYGGIENSFNPAPGVIDVGNEWKHVRCDITEHIERCIEWANRDKAFGVAVEKKDMFFGGCNIGFEIHGNYDVTFEFKNLDMVAYNKD